MTSLQHETLTRSLTLSTACRGSLWMDPRAARVSVCMCVSPHARASGIAIRYVTFAAQLYFAKPSIAYFSRYMTHFLDKKGLCKNHALLLLQGTCENSTANFPSTHAPAHGSKRERAEVCMYSRLGGPHFTTSCKQTILAQRSDVGRRRMRRIEHAGLLL